MLRFGSSFNGVQKFLFIHGFRQIVLYSTSISEVNLKFVNYLVKNLGFSKEQALSTSPKFTHNRLIRSTDFIKNWDLVIAFFKENGLQQSHIQTTISIRPRILMCNVDKTLIPKTEALQKLGFSKPHIAELISFKPSLYLSNDIIPAIQALREILGSYGDATNLILILKRSRRRGTSFIHTCMVPNIALLRSYGIPIDFMRKFLIRNPFIFRLKTDHLQEVMFSVKEKFGIPVNSSQFLAGIHIISSMSQKTIESKMQIYKSFGWNDSEIAALVSLNPRILGHSENSIKKKLDFLMNEVGLEPNYMASKCSLFTCSLENRIVPRHKILLALKENGLMTGYLLPTVVSYTDSKFFNMFVLPFKEAHEVYSKFADMNMEKLPLALPKPKTSAL